MRPLPALAHQKVLSSYFGIVADMSEEPLAALVEDSEAEVEAEAEATQGTEIAAITVHENTSDSVFSPEFQNGERFSADLAAPSKHTEWAYRRRQGLGGCALLALLGPVFLVSFAAGCAAGWMDAAGFGFLDAL